MVEGGCEEMERGESEKGMREIFLWDSMREKRINKGKGEGHTF